MKISFTSVSHGKLGRELNGIYMPMSRTLNERLGGKDYGAGLEVWFLLFIMLPPDLPGADDPERQLFKKKDKVLDLRLHLENEAFRRADLSGRTALVFAVIRRALELTLAKKIPDFDAAAFVADVEAVAQSEGWIAA